MSATFPPMVAMSRFVLDAMYRRASFRYAGTRSDPKASWNVVMLPMRTASGVSPETPFSSGSSVPERRSSVPPARYADESSLMMTASEAEAAAHSSLLMFMSSSQKLNSEAMITQSSLIMKTLV